MRRALYAIPTLIGVALIAFLMLKLAGGNPARQLAGDRQDPQTIANIERELGLDKPAPVQFLLFVGNAVTGDFGRSYSTRQPVSEEIARRYPATMVLAITSTAFAVLGGVGLGLIAGLKPNSARDNIATVITVLGVSIPGFWLALVLIYVFSVQLRLLPSIGLNSPQQLILPVVVQSTFTLAFLARLTRSGIIEVTTADFIRTAKAKGLRNSLIVRRHMLKNALIPIVTVAGVSFGYQLGGTVITESIFAIDGLGSMIVKGILARDMPIVESGILVLAANFIIITLVIDVIYAYLDPRIRY